METWLRDFRTTWSRPENVRRKSGPGADRHEVARALAVLHSSFRADDSLKAWVGPLVNAIIRSSRAGVFPLQISVKAYKALQEGRKTTMEHDPPISFYRDLIIEAPELQASQILGALELLRVTQISLEENQDLTDRGWKQNRPEDAYKQCGIVLHELPEPSAPA